MLVPSGPGREWSLDSLPVLGARGVVLVQPLGQRQQARLRQRGGPERAEPAHGPAGPLEARAQLAGPRRVALDGAPHHVAHRKRARARP